MKRVLSVFLILFSIFWSAVSHSKISTCQLIFSAAGEQARFHTLGIYEEGIQNKISQNKKQKNAVAWEKSQGDLLKRLGSPIRVGQRKISPKGKYLLPIQNSKYSLVNYLQNKFSYFDIETLDYNMTTSAKSKSVSDVTGALQQDRHFGPRHLQQKSDGSIFADLTPTLMLLRAIQQLGKDLASEAIGRNADPEKTKLSIEVEMNINHFNSSVGIIRDPLTGEIVGYMRIQRAEQLNSVLRLPAIQFLNRYAYNLLSLGKLSH